MIQMVVAKVGVNDKMPTDPSQRADSAEESTRESLVEDLAALGVRAGDTLLVHSSLRRVGRVRGGVRAVVNALLDAIGPGGTVVVPTQTLNNRDPSRWQHAPVPEARWPTLRATLPPFNPAITPSVGMGQVAECIRGWPGAARSGHPLTSFAAVGARASALTAIHSIESMLGEESPLAAVERAGGRVLLIGVGFDKCTAFHLAEYRQPVQPRCLISSVMRTPRGREWVSYESVRLRDRDFGALGAAFEAQSGSVLGGAVGAAEGRLFPVRDAVSFAAEWIIHHRPGYSQPITRLSEGGTECP